MPESQATPADFELARAALLDITPAETIGEPAGSVDEGEGVVSVYFDTTMAGYKGWRWTVSIAHVEGTDATVLETEMTPGETALLSPAWVPWADRLADYKASQGDQPSDEVDDSDDDDDDFDDEDVNDDDEALLHSGDLDGVDIDSLEDDDDDDDDDDESDDDSDDNDSAPAANVAQPDDAGAQKTRVSRSKKKTGD